MDRHVCLNVTVGFWEIALWWSVTTSVETGILQRGNPPVSDISFASGCTSAFY